MCNCSTHPKATAAGAAVQGTTFSIEDMTCSHCAGTIHRALTQGMPGTPFSVDLETQRVSVDGDADRAAALIRDAGYEPVLVAQ